MKDRYVNPFTDFGFKRLFGEELNKDLLIDFLNQLLAKENVKIKKLKFLKNEHLGNTKVDRKAIYDLYCENEQGEKFIVELQKAKQNFFKDRSVFYSTFPIQEQAEQGEWNFKLKAVYTIGILDFVFDEDKDNKEKFHYTVTLMDEETHKRFYDKLMFIYLEMPKFNKTEKELKTRYEKWLYVLKNLSRLQSRPKKLQDKVFKKVFEIAELAQFTPEQRQQYESSLKYYRDLNNVIDTAREEGRAEGREEGRAEGVEEGKQKEKKELAKNLLDVLDDNTISLKTGLPIETVKVLRTE